MTPETTRPVGDGVLRGASELLRQDSGAARRLRRVQYGIAGSLLAVSTAATLALIVITRL